MEKMVGCIDIYENKSFGMSFYEFYKKEDQEKLEAIMRRYSGTAFLRGTAEEMSIFSLMKKFGFTFEDFHVTDDDFHKNLGLIYQYDDGDYGLSFNPALSDADNETIDEIVMSYIDGCGFRGCPEDDVKPTDVFEWFPPIGIEKICVQLVS